ncbi:MULTISPECIES: NAD-dependent epimerase/dehydratase family protein [Pseudoalteromonas]|uniref:NAD-dependent epimerase/dehydratase family protein n=1 Tax=Pseudoalteromonas TaxID=53246 RepID=UPI00057F3F8B|nr:MULTISPECIES: NAD-dependent epimerase/dehydratase family protein [Pseudoalteromonas]KID36160.1 hypothetical protein QT15_11100 [Pseudoalteromonas flavipulchra NCIMB 2033 = ATCC BAA-314]MBD0780331.1 SDR family oxidoreductase [Pseudoalteromonas flavipulchra]MBE0371587.1 hypothetical protein [Pseudoalteromonas flavipulchra NCIMB 2033 = ATCC BAA-314]MDP4488984.1 NAD-dependent epimerase/dehydratase family protein [Pseudoalteromonas piscicida]
MRRVTVIGATGFVGREFIKYLEGFGYELQCPKREELDDLNGEVGTIVYIAGYGICDDIHNKLSCVQANSVRLISILKNCKFDRLIYFSSTRLYMGSTNSDESTDLLLLNDDCRRLFNLTKLVSEELCLSFEDAIIVRPSNIYGTALKSPLFLPSIARDAIKHSRIDMYVTPSYEKDYIDVRDVCVLVEKLISSKVLKNKIYNLASGENTMAKDIANVIESETGAEVLWHDVNKEDTFPVTNISNIVNEFGFKPKNVLTELKKMIEDFKCAHKKGMF